MSQQAKAEGLAQRAKQAAEECLRDAASFDAKPGPLPSRIIRANELAERLGVSRVTLWRWERDGRLPRKWRIGPNVTGWIEQEIEEWWAAKSLRRDSGETPTPAGPEEAKAPTLRVVGTREGA